MNSVLPNEAAARRTFRYTSVPYERVASKYCLRSVPSASSTASTIARSKQLRSITVTSDATASSPHFSASRCVKCG